MSTKLDRIAEIAKAKPKEQFTSLIHLIDKEMLKQCHEELDGNKATGTDKVTKQEYEMKLEENIDGLIVRMKNHTYKPLPVKRVYIPKPGSEKKRPLGIPSYEDKIVQLAINKILNAIYEQDFLDCSFGFRPNRSCHDAIKILDVYLCNRNTNYVVDADVKGFFDHVSHEWLMKFLEVRIKDPNLLRLIGRFLKAGIMEEGKFYKAYEGTPQGGIISPTLANIYLHYVLDLWFEKVVKKYCEGKVYLVRYADDFIACFETEKHALAYYSALVKRLNKFNLEIAEDKTKILSYGAKAYYEHKDKGGPKPPTFDFLGFTHYCDSNKDGRYRTKRRTSNKKFRASLMRCKLWIIESRTLPLFEIIKKLKQKLTGYYRYYCITDNMKNVRNYEKRVLLLVYKWLNRRSQRKSYKWSGYREMLDHFKVPKPKLYVSIFELKQTISYIR
jgi:RNA-directed DNA polymerase